MEINPQVIEQHWPLSEVSVVETLKEQEEGRVIIKIQALEGVFIYRLADPSKQNALDKELLIFNFLPQNGFPAITKLLKTRDNKFYKKIDGRCAYVLEYVDGEHPQSVPETYRQLGILTAQLHDTKGYPYDTEFDADYIAENHLSDRAENLPFRDEYLALAKTLPKFNHLPHALIHTDIGTHNTIQRPNGELVIIDWDDVGNGPAVLDVGFLIIQHFMNEECVFQEENARAFYETYFSKRTMTEEEKSLLFDAGLFIALDYIVYGDVEKRWRCIQWALKNRIHLEDVFRS